MKSMSMDDHGMSRLYCVCKCRIGFRSNLRPLIHILDGEKVWHHVTRPMQWVVWLASSQSADTSAGVLRTGLKMILVGIEPALFKPAAISRESVATCFSVSGP